MATSERGEHIGITAPFENVSKSNNTLDVFNTIDETRNNIPDEVSELSVPGTHFDRQSHIHHNRWRIKFSNSSINSSVSVLGHLQLFQFIREQLSWPEIITKHFIGLHNKIIAMSSSFCL